MKTRIYLLLTLFFILTQYSYGQFLDYVPLLNNGSNRAVEKNDYEWRKQMDKISEEAKPFPEKHIITERNRSSSQPTLVSEELLTATGVNINKETEVIAKISQQTYSNGQTILYVIGLKYKNDWMPIKNILLSEISALLRQTDLNNDAKRILLEMSEYANYMTIINDEYFLF